MIKMVNPNKYENNLNVNDIKLILDFLDNEYDSCKNKKDKKEINQIRMIILLATKELNTKDLIALSTLEARTYKDQNLQNYINEHLRNNFCKMEGLLLTNYNNNPYSKKDIESLLKKIEISKLNKKISIETLNITKKHNKNSFNKDKIVSLDNNEDKKIENRNVTYQNKSSNKNTDSDSLKNLNNKINEIDKKLDVNNKEVEKCHEEIEKIDKNLNIDSINLLKSNVNKLKDNFEKLDNYVTYNVYKEDIDDINNKIDEIVKYVNKMNNIQNDNIKRINEIKKENKNIKNKLNNTEKIKKDSNNIKKHSNISSTKKSSKTNVNTKPYTNNKKYDSYELLSKWLKNNIIITENAHDNVNSEEIINKISKLFNEKNIEVKEEDLKNNIKKILLSYYKTKDKDIQSSDINKDTKNNDIFSFMKFISPSEQDTERNNKFKKIMEEWIKYNTVKTDDKNDKTFTKNIVEYLKPLFEKEGWIFLSKDTYKEDSKSGEKKICDNWTFSKLVGRAVSSVYESVSEEKAVENNRMYYPGIKIKETESEKIKKINDMIDEISYPFENDDYLLSNWFNNNLVYSNNSNDKINLDEILLKIKGHLKENNLEISDDFIKKLFKRYLSKFRDKNTNENSISDNYLIGFTWKNNSIRTWINNYLTITSSSNDKISYKKICDLIYVYLPEHNITRVKDELYNEMPDHLKDKFISETEFNNNINYELDKYSKFKIIKEDDIYYTNIKYLNFKEITVDTMKKWINNNIKIIDDKDHIISQKKIIKKFKEDMIENNFKNIKEINLEKEVFNNINNYYLNNKKENIQILKNENDEKYYRSIKLKN